MTEKQLQYQLADKSLVPLFEADHDMAFKIYRADQRKAVIADPLRCIEAKGLCRLKGVTEAYVGSGGDAYVIFEWSPNRPYPHAVHFTIPRKTAKPRDAFDAGKKIPTQELHLRMPTKGRTRAHRTNLMKGRKTRG
jgi:hypothetical protein